MLSVNRQIRQEFFTMLPLPSIRHISDGCDHTCSLHAICHLQHKEDLIDVELKANFQRSAQMAKCNFQFGCCSSGYRLDEASVRAVLVLLRDFFTGLKGVTILDILVAVDRVLTISFTVCRDPTTETVGQSGRWYMTQPKLFRYHCVTVKAFGSKGDLEISVYHD